ncbi:hypothetical protein B0T26DRAFT_228248 [Lasiosphaeria miniovina]|uniref:Uncharacterized protein n=1 Tax=Lasiosphaeria miniovina TaxID=1954250 RepID=A0AA40E3E4_9PEZI|nr:uncharacterized protein B0T26DRAFT_228248 [Lasiosphaeria miniovina]KAK0722631.1 hypothetical protein B0T26DRAFT_228248 [Lasiosphaeria miniovina]
MTVQQQQSRFSDTDQESVYALLHGYTADAVEEEGNERPFVAPDTEEERNRVWTAWTEFCGLTGQKEGAVDSCGVDPCRFWVTFAQDPTAAKVQAPVRVFLHQYVQSSCKERVVLGPALPSDQSDQI